MKRAMMTLWAMLMVVCLCSCAVAEGIPSISASETANLLQLECADGTSVDDEFMIIIVEETEQQVKELQNLRSFVRDQKKPVAGWYTSEQLGQLKDTVGEDIDENSLIVYDYLPLMCVNYKEAYGDVWATFSFATPYQTGKVVAAVMGIPAEGATTLSVMDWTASSAVVEDNGIVKILFSQEMLMSMMETPHLMLLLAEPLNP